MLSTTTFKFLKELKKNNNRTWFEENRERYLQSKQDFENFIGSLLLKMKSFDHNLSDLEARNCLFRLNRDVRFSADKTPYKSHFGAYMAKGGKKSVYAGYYFHLEPGKCFAGGGLWMPAKDELHKVRQEIDYSYASFKKIINAPAFKKIYTAPDREKGQVLVNMPKGYEKDNEAGHFLKLKSFTTTFEIKDAEVLEKNFVRTVARNFEALHSFIEFLNTAVE
ncbi:MAG: DUF2461 domain-containing protein [Bacteroidetes bacterium]|nr:DUF2461 domain-containing protein [Bacteroidota bacterium]